MALPVTSVQKLKKGLYRILWNTDSYRRNSSSFKYSSEVKLTSLGIDDDDECYRIECSMDPYLKLTLITIASDESTNNFKKRKVVARFLGYEKEMGFSLHFTSDSKKDTDSKQVLNEQSKVDFTWTAQWTEITRVGCSCNGRQGVAEIFEIRIDMDPTGSLERGQQSVLDHLLNLWETKNRANVIFRCGDRDMKAHSLVVSTASSILADMIKKGFNEKNERIVVVEEIEADVFEKLLCFIYTGDFDFEFHDIPALLVAADTYDVSSLKKECEKYLSRNITLENATHYLILSHLHKADELLIATLEYIQKNSGEICSRTDWMSVIKNYPDLGFIAVQFMVKKIECTPFYLATLKFQCSLAEM